MWEQQYQEAFEAIKELLVSPAVLEVPVQGHQYIVRTDYSATGMGYLLTQIRPATEDSPEREAIMAFDSKSFSQAPVLSGSSKLELFGLSLAVHCFRHYLTGEHLLIYCDNSGANPKTFISTKQRSFTHCHEVSVFLNNSKKFLSFEMP